MLFQYSISCYQKELHTCKDSHVILILTLDIYEFHGYEETQIHIAPALLSIVPSWFLTWRVMTWLGPPMNCCPMNTAGTLLQPSCCNACSICCPFGIWSSSYTVGLAPKPLISDLIEWLMQQELRLKITTGRSVTILVITSMVVLCMWRRRWEGARVNVGFAEFKGCLSAELWGKMSVVGGLFILIYDMSMHENNTE